MTRVMRGVVQHRRGRQARAQEEREAKGECSDCWKRARGRARRNQRCTGWGHWRLLDRPTDGRLRERVWPVSWLAGLCLPAPSRFPSGRCSSARRSQLRGQPRIRDRKRSPTAFPFHPRANAHGEPSRYGTYAFSATRGKGCAALFPLRGARETGGHQYLTIGICRNARTLRRMVLRGSRRRYKRHQRVAHTVNRRRHRRTSGMSTERTSSPSGTIQKPSTGRKPTRPRSTRPMPIPILRMRLAGSATRLLPNFIDAIFSAPHRPRRIEVAPEGHCSLHRQMQASGPWAIGSKAWQRRSAFAIAFLQWR